jgi:hypothetical protein
MSATSSVWFEEGPAEGRQRHHSVEALGDAEALLRERKVRADDQDDDIVEARYALVEGACRRLADRGVVARVDREDLFLPREASECVLAQVGSNEEEVRGGAATCGQVAIGLNRGSFERGSSHDSPSKARVGRLYKDIGRNSNRLPAKKKFIISSR